MTGKHIARKRARRHGQRNKYITLATCTDSTILLVSCPITSATGLAKRYLGGEQVRSSLWQRGRIRDDTTKRMDAKRKASKNIINCHLPLYIRTCKDESKRFSSVPPLGISVYDDSRRLTSSSLNSPPYLRQFIPPRCVAPSLRFQWCVRRSA